MRSRNRRVELWVQTITLDSPVDSAAILKACSHSVEIEHHTSFAAHLELFRYQTLARDRASGKRSVTDASISSRNADAAMALS